MLSSAAGDRPGSPLCAAAEWERLYAEGLAPWDTGVPSRELCRVLAEEGVGPCRALELGCGTGTNAVHLARLGFSVVALDASPRAIGQARRRAADAGVEVEFLAADLLGLAADLGLFDFVFDRGCYTAVVRQNLQGYLTTLRRFTRPGARFLLLAASAAEVTPGGPVRVHGDEIRVHFGALFEIRSLAEFRSLARGGDGPLAWSCRMVRKAEA